MSSKNDFIDHNPPKNVGGMYSGKQNCGYSPPCPQKPVCDDGASIHLSLHGVWDNLLCPCKDAWDPCALIVEFLGSWFLIFAITMSAICICDLEGSNGLVLGKLLVGLTAGLVLYFLASAFGHVSGGHFNSFVTLAVLLCGKINPLAALLYVLMHFLGAIVAGAFTLIFYDSYHCCLGAPQVGDGVSVGTALAAEIIGTFILVLVVLYSHKKAVKCPAGAVAAALGLLHFVFIPFSGASLNFWRYLGPAIFADCFHYWWIYLVGPLVGTIAAILFYKLCCFFKYGAPSFYASRTTVHEY